MKRTRRIGVAACCLGAFIGLTHVQIYAQDQKKSEDVTKVAYEDLGAIDAIWEAEHRLGGTDRIFLIEDSWELNRCAELLPKLPKIDVEKELLLIVMSWSSSVRTLKSIEADADTLVISVVEAKPPLYRSGPYQPPEFLVFKLPAWKGPVRVVINERPKFIIHRGDALQKRTNDIWEEILRLHSGGRPTLPQQVRRYQRMWPENSEREIKQYIMENKERFRREEVSPYYEILFRDLVNTRAKPAIPRIFSLIESMGKHDKALGPATGALVGIGGPEVVEQCKIAIKSWNPQSRSTAWGLLARFATGLLPKRRSMCYESLRSPAGRGDSR